MENGIDLKRELGLYFDDLTDLMFYFQEHYDSFTKEQLMFVISTIVQYELGD